MKTWIIKLSMLTLFLTISLFIQGCSTGNKKADGFEKWRILARKSQALTPVPEKKQYVQIESAGQKKSTQKKEEEKKAGLQQKKQEHKTKQLPKMPVTMQMNDVSISVLLKTLARIADVDLIINDTVKGITKVNIKAVPWDQAFLSLLDTYGLGYEWSNMILRVISVEDLKKKKEFLKAKQEYEQSKKRHSIAMMQINQEQERLKPLITRIVKIHYADLNSLQANLEKYLFEENQDSQNDNTDQKNISQGKSKGRGSIMVDEFSNSLIIKAVKDDIDRVIPILEQLDKPIKQVRVEAHIVEANSDVARQLGIQWGGVGLAESGSDNNYWVGGDMGPSETSIKDAADASIASNPNDGAIVNLPVTDPALSLGIMAESLGDFRLYAELSALEEQGELNIISKPSITTMDNRKAIIKSGKQIPFQTVADGETKIEFKEAVIKLEVTPHIIDDTIVRLEINTHKDEVDFSNTVNGNPTIITKNAETRVTLFDGQTTVIGGLNKEKSSDGESGVPGLKDIPGVGWLFKNTNRQKDMEELLIFITPYIMKEKQRIKKAG